MNGSVDCLFRRKQTIREAVCLLSTDCLDRSDFSKTEVAERHVR